MRALTSTSTRPRHGRISSHPKNRRIPSRKKTKVSDVSTIDLYARKDMTMSMHANFQSHGTSPSNMKVKSNMHTTTAARVPSPTYRANRQLARVLRAASLYFADAPTLECNVTFAIVSGDSATFTVVASERGREYGSTLALADVAAYNDAGLRDEIDWLIGHVVSEVHDGDEFGLS
jgi:hypothetical protein